jgi:hypothetical protein
LTAKADVAELVDARDLKSLDGNVVWVRLPPPAPGRPVLPQRPPHQQNIENNPMQSSKRVGAAFPPSHLVQPKRVEQEAVQSAEAGARSVPHFIFGGHTAISGGRSEDEIALRVQEAARAQVKQRQSMMVHLYGKVRKTLRQHLIKPELPHQAPGTRDLGAEVNFQNVGHGR